MRKLKFTPLEKMMEEEKFSSETLTKMQQNIDGAKMIMDEMDNGEHAIDNEMRYFLIAYRYILYSRVWGAKIAIGRLFTQQKDYPVEAEAMEFIANRVVECRGQPVSIIGVTEMTAEDYKTFFGYR